MPPHQTSAMCMQGYRHSVKGRMTGVGHFFCLMALALLNIVWGVQLLQKGYFGN